MKVKTITIKVKNLFSKHGVNFLLIQNSSPCQSSIYVHPQPKTRVVTFCISKVNKVVVQLIFLLLPTISLYYQLDLLQCDSFYALGLRLSYQQTNQICPPPTTRTY